MIQYSNYDSKSQYLKQNIELKNNETKIVKQIKAMFTLPRNSNGEM